MTAAAALTAEQFADFDAYFRDLEADGRREGYSVDRETEFQIWVDRVASDDGSEDA